MDTSIKSRNQIFLLRKNFERTNLAYVQASPSITHLTIAFTLFPKSSLQQ